MAATDIQIKIRVDTTSASQPTVELYRVPPYMIALTPADDPDDAEYAEACPGVDSAAPEPQQHPRVGSDLR